MSASENAPKRRSSPSWASYRKSIGDRSSLFGALAAQWHPTSALSAGSYLDLSPSTAIPSVTYVDTDRRAARYFADKDLVATQLAGRTLPGAGTDVTFLQADYTRALPLPDGSFDLLISLYAGPVWENCRRYLAPTGVFLANTSHGDASLAALDPTLELAAAVVHRADRYHLDTKELDSYLVPKRPSAADSATIREQGRGIAYTRTAFAYVFTAVADRP